MDVSVIALPTRKGGAEWPALGNSSAGPARLPSEGAPAPPRSVLSAWTEADGAGTTVSGGQTRAPGALAIVMFAISEPTVRARLCLVLPATHTDGSPQSLPTEEETEARSPESDSPEVTQLELVGLGLHRRSLGSEVPRNPSLRPPQVSHT